MTDRDPVKKALVTGISGQDGSYLAEMLIEKGYQVHGLVQPAGEGLPQSSLARIQHLVGQVVLHPISLGDYAALFQLFEQVQPDEYYHLAAASVVSYSSDEEMEIFDTNIRGMHHVLSAVRRATPGCCLFFAASSEMFGRADRSPQDENTPFHPRSAYGISKVTGFHLVRMYRENHGFFACSGILYNHESERRGGEFVTRKITQTVARIKLGLATELHLGNLDAMRDWGYAPDYVEAMWLMLQQDRPDDFVIATGEPHSVRDFAAAAFAEVGLDWQRYVKVDPRFYRPAEKVILTGNAARARERLGWSPRVRFEDLVRRMVIADLERIGSETGKNPV